MPKKLTQKEFEEKVYKINQNVDLSEFVYINSGTKGHCKCKICGNEWDVVAQSLMNGIGCRKCFDKRNSEKRTTPLQKIQEGLDCEGRNITIIGEYIDTKHKTRFKCNVCGYEWEDKARNIIDGKKCPECSKREKEKELINSDEVIEKCKKLYGEKYSYVTVSQRIRATDYIDYICPKHGFIHQNISIHLRGKGCPLCHWEKLENIVRRKLNSRNVEYLENVDIFNSGYLTSFYIPEKKIAIDIIGREFFDETDSYGGKEWGNIRFKKLFENNEKCKNEDILAVYLTYNKEKTPKNLCSFEGRGDFAKWVDAIIPKPKKERPQKENKPKIPKRKYASDDERNLAMHNMFAKTTEEFIREANEKHNNKYKYDKTVYLRNTDKVCITCPEHGDFWQIPKTHLKGGGCPKCGVDKIKSILSKSGEDFIKDAVKLHGEKYDYSKVIYKNSSTKVEIICHKKDKNGIEHGPFMVTPANFLNGHACPKCAIEKNTNNRTFTFEEFKRRAIEKHGETYEYDKETYVKTMKKTRIICQKHGEFWMTPHSHLLGQGCPVCGSINGGLKIRLAQDEFIKRAKEIHGEKYDYSMVEYQTLRTPVEIICPKHGMFKQKPSTHLSGCGCPKCSESRLEKEVAKALEEEKIKYERQKHFKWLGMQSLDFYIPELNIGIECQGAPHFMSDFYNRKNQDPTLRGYKGVLKRDKMKNRLCNENGVDLIYYFPSFFNEKYIFNNIFFNTTEDLLKYVLKIKTKTQ